MVRLTSPGLPSWPPLLFDEHSQRAFVYARFANWKAYKNASTTEQFVTGAYMFTLLPMTWLWLADIDFNLHRLFWTIVVWFVVGVPTAWLMRRALPDCLARQFFASTLTLWFTSDAIAFKSGLYVRPVVLSKHWKSKNVSIDFAIDDDRAAKHQLATLGQSQQTVQGHMQSSQRLILIVQDKSCDQTQLIESESAMKSLPICEMSAAEVEKVVVVCKAAQMLTDRKIGGKPYTPPSGVDIDA